MTPLPAFLDCGVVAAHEPDPEREEPILAKPSREDLLKRHREAERKKAITVCRNLVAKHEALEATQSAKLKETNVALEQARKELDENQRDIEAAQHTIETLRLRKQAVQSLIGEYVTKLVDTRRALHEHKTQLELE
jgi:chromosome segregation ATPase